MARNRFAQAGSLVASIAIAQVSGSLVSLTAEQSVKTWYPALRKPSFTPPSGVFGPVWSILYLMMGVSKFMVDEQVREGSVPPGKARSARRMYYGQLLVNLAWTPLFFGLKRPLLALGDQVILLPLLLRTIAAFRTISPAAGLLLVPYLVWTGFATVLNAAICLLNRPDHA